MKKIYTILSTLVVFVASTFAQIDTVFISPAGPTTSDSVKVTAYTTFTSGGCDTLSLGVNPGSLITVDACHQSGFTAVICHDSITINLGLLAAGSYDLDYIVRQPNPVTDPTNCTGEPVADSVRVKFTVTGSSGMGSLSAPKNLVMLFPNPTDGAIAIQYDLNKAEEGATLVIYNIVGQVVKQVPLINKKGAIIENISNLSKGSYFYRVETPSYTGTVDRLNVIK